MTPALNRIPFLYLRHGETDWNAQGLSQGNIDIPLNATGRAQAVAAAPLLRGRGVRTIVSSPLSRARDTAEAVAAALDLPVLVDADLREVGFGTHEGKPMADWFAAWVDGAFTPEGAEPFQQLRARAVGAVNRATAHAGMVLIVGHGAFFRAIRSAAGLLANVRTRNATPLRMDPPADGEASWQLSLLEAGPGGG